MGSVPFMWWLFAANSPNWTENPSQRALMLTTAGASLEIDFTHSIPADFMTVVCCKLLTACRRHKMLQNDTYVSYQCVIFWAYGKEELLAAAKGLRTIASHGRRNAQRTVCARLSHPRHRQSQNESKLKKAWSKSRRGSQNGLHLVACSTPFENLRKSQCKIISRGGQVQKTICFDQTSLALGASLLKCQESCFLGSGFPRVRMGSFPTTGKEGCKNI